MSVLSPCMSVYHMHNLVPLEVRRRLQFPWNCSWSDPLASKQLGSCVYGVWGKATGSAGNNLQSDLRCFTSFLLGFATKWPQHISFKGWMNIIPIPRDGETSKPTNKQAASSISIPVGCWVMNPWHSAPSCLYWPLLIACRYVDSYMWG